MCVLRSDFRPGGFEPRRTGQGGDEEEEGGDDEETEAGEAESTEELVTVSRSVLSDLAETLGGIDGAGDAAAVVSGLLEAAPAAEGGSGA